MGKFVLEIDSTGTEVWLTYNTKLSFTNKPKNLKMYSDSAKTQELSIENDTYLCFNGFMDNQSSKKEDIHIYWDWPIETGYTSEQISENNISDTSFYGKTLSSNDMTLRIKGEVRLEGSGTITGNIGSSSTTQGQIIDYR